MSFVCSGHVYRFSCGKKNKRVSHFAIEFSRQTDIVYFVSMTSCVLPSFDGFDVAGWEFESKLADEKMARRRAR